MTDLSPEVRNALVRLVNGDFDLDKLTDDQLFEIAKILRPDDARELLFRTLTLLYEERKYTFASIGDHLGVHEATASRWAKPPAEDRRRRRTAREDEAEEP